MNEILSPFKLKSNASLLISGPTMSGKSTIVKKILQSQHLLFNKSFDAIILCYGTLSPAYLELMGEFPNMKLMEGFPSEFVLKPEEHFDREKSTCLILEDLQHALGDGKLISHLLSAVTHHWNVFCIVILQNIFLPIRHIRTIHRNAAYLILTPSSRDLNSVSVLGRQIFNNSKFLLSAYEDAIHGKTKYLFLNLDPFLEDRQLMVTTGLFENETLYVYLPK